MSAGAANDLAEKGFLDWALQATSSNSPYSVPSDKKIEEMYALAHFLYGQKHYLDASHFFRLLIAARPSGVKYWKGLGACQQMLKEYEEAIQCYSAAQILNGSASDPYLYLHAADCYIALNDVRGAFVALDAAKKRASITKDQRVLKHVKIMRDLWSHVPKTR